MKKFILSIKLKLFAEKHKIQRILETRNHFELYFLENAQEERAELSEKMEMKKVVKIINSTVLTEKNKKEEELKTLETNLAEKEKNYNELKSKTDKK